MTRRRAAHLVLVIAGLAFAAFGAWRLANPHITCRGQEMHPGDVCHQAGYSTLTTDKVQTYETRLNAYHESLPAVIVIGVLAAGFGGALYRQDVRRHRKES